MKKKKFSILLVENNPLDVRLVQQLLRDASFKTELTLASELAEITETIKKKHFDLILLDLSLPDSDGLNTLLRTQDLLPNIPTVVLTSLDNEELSLASIQAGAQDYLIKGLISGKLLQKTIHYAILRFHTIKKINKFEHSHKAYLATHDVVTSLPSQQLFLEHLELTINKYNQIKKPFAVLLLELSHIHNLENKIGVLEKDKILKDIAHKLLMNLDPEYFIARYSEGTFGLLITKTPRSALLENVTDTIHQTLLEDDHRNITLPYHIGISLFPSSGDNAAKLIAAAQTALVKAEKNDTRYEIYTKQLKPTTNDNEISWSNDLQRAIERQEFFILYQPQVDSMRQQVNGVEALLRWQHPKLGVISPIKFIPMAEENHLMSAIGDWVLENVAKQYQSWRNQAQGLIPLRLSVNVSAQQLEQGNLIKTVQQILSKYRMPPQCLGIELTESIFITNPESIIDQLNNLKKIGVQIALDDFGRGYSSLSYLSHLPLDFLKLDMNFVQNINENKNTRIAVRSVIDLAHSLRYLVTAEGVETEAEYEVLKKQHCDEVQGFYFSAPMPPGNISNIIFNGLMIKPDK